MKDRGAFCVHRHRGPGGIGRACHDHFHRPGGGLLGTERAAVRRPGKSSTAKKVTPAEIQGRPISKDALKKISGQVRTWRLDHRIGSTFAQLAKAINPIVGGWMQYYGAFYQTALYSLLARINSYLVRWIRHKYRRLKTVKKALRAYYGATRAYPAMFRHWRWNPSAWRTG
ncbi:group II intron maturase-specific domain-containing protein [Nonomuraea sp. NPDC049480]|uniref:group II intron maturase-specific domain-containing protein n=1 Tax=Nonomuraea sp. NPDC049480 TaxID=3364353 RepID=UPI00379B6079